MAILATLGKKLDFAIREVNSPHWSLTKLAMLIFLYPAITIVFLFDAVHNNRMDWMNTAIFICGIVTPRLISQMVAARFGYKGDAKVLDGETPPAKKKDDDEEGVVEEKK